MYKIYKNKIINTTHLYVLFIILYVPAANRSSRQIVVATYIVFISWHIYFGSPLHKLWGELSKALVPYLSKSWFIRGTTIVFDRNMWIVYILRSTKFQQKRD